MKNCLKENLIKKEQEYRSKSLYFEAKANEASYMQMYYMEKANEVLEKLKMAD